MSNCPASARCAGLCAAGLSDRAPEGQELSDGGMLCVLRTSAVWLHAPEWQTKA